MKNVLEKWCIYDTVLVTRAVAEAGGTIINPGGWFVDFQQLSTANQIGFFNVRNRQVGLAWNNQDTRDQMPYVFHLHSIGIRFFAPTVTEMHNDPTPVAGRNLPQAVWTLDLPNHVSAVLVIQQDEKLKINAMMAPSGYGAQGGGAAQGDPQIYGLGMSLHKMTYNQGVPTIGNRWVFPVPYGIPRTASLRMTLKFSEYGRALLAAMTGPFHYAYRKETPFPPSWEQLATTYGIQVTLDGYREVQQRGALHV